MSAAVTMPKLGLTMVEGTVTHWYRQPGEPVQKGEPLVEVATDKINAVVESPADGLLQAILAPEGSTVLVGAPLAEIGDSGSTLASAPTIDRALIRASPYARALARSRGIDLSAVPGTGPRQMVVARDLPAQAPPAPAAAKVAPVVDLSAERQATARRPAAPVGTIPQVTLFTDAPAGRLLAMREELKRSGDQAPDLSLSDLLVALLARALREFPYVNASLEGDEIIRWEQIHIGLAVAGENGLIVPVIREADRLPLSRIAAVRSDLAARARSGDLNSDEVTGGTFTLIDLGTYGIDGFTPIISPPEAAILGVGRVVARPVRRGGEWAEERFITLSLSFDHRLMDGAQAARFLARVADLVEHPVQLLF